MSKCKSGHKDGQRYGEAFDACAAAVDEGSALFPLSLSTLMEINAIRDPQQRLRLRWVMEQLSGFRAVLPRAVTAFLEFEQVLADRLDRIRARTAPRDFVGIGAGWMVGKSLAPSVFDEQGRDVTTEVLPSLRPELRSLLDPEFMSYTLTGIFPQSRYAVGVDRYGLAQFDPIVRSSARREAGEACVECQVPPGVAAKQGRREVGVLRADLVEATSEYRCP